MKENTLHIKNMVCPRCKLSVEEILTRLGIPYSEVTLGQVKLQAPLEAEMQERLSLELGKVGFELAEERNQKISNRIKAIIIEQIYSEDGATGNLSETLSEKLNYDYSHLTSIFRQTEEQSIQNFQNKIRLERIKELLEYDEMNIS
ncbi:MAG: AraC family transcriptional regulator, partial [Salegentibacter sp.]